jgi:hypothetical protein
VAKYVELAELGAVTDAQEPLHHGPRLSARNEAAIALADVDTHHAAVKTNGAARPDKLGRR